MAMLGKVQRMCYRDKLSLNEIARHTGLARNTIKKWLKAPDGTKPKCRRAVKVRELAAYEAQLVQALEADAHLFDQLIPHVPFRHWVLSFPIPLRNPFAAHPELLTPVLRIVHRVIT